MTAEVDYKPYLHGVLKFLHGINEEDRWAIVKKGMDRSVNILGRGRPVLFFLVEETKAGGPHAVQALYDPKERAAILEIPEEPEQQGGRFPTVLHAVEMIASVTKLANQRMELPHPQVRFVDRLRGRIQELGVVLIPLTLDTDRSNIIAFHPQARHIDPETLAYAYYEGIKADTELPEDLIRHTMLVQALNGDKPLTKNEVTLRVLPHEETGNYRLMYPGRIARWSSSNVNRYISLRRIV